MQRDLTAWALLTAGIAIPVVADAAGLPFVLRDIDGGPYFQISPLWSLTAQLLVVAGFLSRSSTLFATGAAISVLAGLALILGSAIQLPLAELEGMTRVEIVVAHAAMAATGAAWVVLATRVAGQSFRKKASARR